MTSYEDNLLSPAAVDDRVDLIELAVRLLVEWRLWLIASAIFFLLGVGIIYSITPLFEAKAAILPQSKTGVSGVAALLGGHSSNSDMYLGLLASRSVEDAVIDSVHLEDVYKVRSRELARKLLADRSVFKVGTDTLISIKVRDQNGQVAMQIANAYLDALERFQDATAAHSADVRSRFFQAELAKEETALANSEDALKKVQMQTGVIEPIAQTQIGLNQLAQTRAQVTALKVQLSSLLLGASEQNPQVLQLRAEIASLEQQVRQMEASGKNQNANDPSVRSMPGLNLDFANKYRDVQYHEALMKALTTQYQVARLDANFGEATFDVVDRGVVPEHKAWPPRLLLLIGDVIVSSLLGVLLVVLILFVRRIRTDPANSSHWSTLQASFRSHR